MWDTGLKPSLRKVSPAKGSFAKPSPKAHFNVQWHCCRQDASPKAGFSTFPLGFSRLLQVQVYHIHQPLPAGCCRQIGPCSSAQPQDPTGSERGRRTAWKTYVQPPNLQMTSTAAHTLRSHIQQLRNLRKRSFSCPKEEQRMIN